MKHRVSVYGSLKQGKGNSRLLTNAELLGVDTIDGWKMLDLGAFPGIIKGQGTIHIEVYDVSEDEFNSLDHLEGFPTFYNRTQVDTEYGKSWIYYLNNPTRYEEDLVVIGGNW